MGAIKLMTSLFQNYSLFETWGPLWLALVIWLGYSYKKHIVNSPEYEVGSGREKFFYTGIVLLYLLHGSPFSIIADYFLFIALITQMSLTYFVIIFLLIVVFSFIFFQKYVWYDK